MGKGKWKRQFLAAFLAVAMVFTTVNFAPMGAVTVHAEGESTALQPGEYYVMNVATGKYLNAGTTWGTHASLLDYGQLVTVSSASVTPEDGGTYKIKTNIRSGGYLGMDKDGYAYMDITDASKTDLKITNCGNGSFTILDAQNKYLSAVEGKAVADFVESDSDKSKWRFLTREQFIENAVSAVSDTTPVDVTTLIFDPDFGRGNTYISKWSANLSIGNETGDGYDGDGAETGANWSVEKYETSFDSNQILEGVPNGVYELSVQGYYRMDGDGARPVYYANEAENPLKAVETEGKDAADEFWTTLHKEKYVPNNRYQASRSLATGAYQNDPVTVEVTNHTLKVGVKMAAAATRDWIIWDNFKLELKRLITDDEIAAREVVKAIEEIGEVSLKPSCKAKIDAARAAYNALTDEGKEFVTNLEVLEKAETDYDALLEAGGEGALDRVAAEETVETINAIGEVTLTEESKAKIETARAAYDALTEAQKAYVTAEQLKVLTDAEETYDQLATDAAIAKIVAIGTVDLTDACKARIEAARAAYDALTDSQKALVEEEELEKLTNAESQFPKLIPEQQVLADGDYYIVNKKTGRLLNGANSWGTQASAVTYGQLVTVSLLEGDTYHYNIDTHISNGGERHFLTADAWTDGVATPLVIAKSENGSFTIANASGGYLTANDEDTLLAYGRRTDYSEWDILTREEYIEAALGTVAEDNPVDLTSLILDSNFSRNNTYGGFDTVVKDNNKDTGYRDSTGNGSWKGVVRKGGKNNKDSEDYPQNYCVEKYHAAFDSYQTIENIPNGVYEVSLQGFCSAGANSQNPALYYANGEEKEIMAIAAGGKAEADGGWTNKVGDVYVPNGMGDASLCFTAGGYQNEPVTVTVTDHTLKVGVKTTDKNNWVLWDAFTLKLKSVADSEFAERAAAKIDAIGEVELTDACKAKIDAARAAYDALTDAQKALITEKEAVLTTAETKYADLGKAAAVVEKIDEIGTYTFTTACKKRIDAARAAYDALTDAQKALVTEEQLKVLTDAEAAYQKDFTEKGQAGLNQADADAAVALIDAIGEVALTEESKAKIDAAKEAYDALIADAKALVAAEKVTILNNAIAKYQELENAADQAVVDEVVTKIGAIGTVAFTADCRLAIKAARSAYDALTDKQKSLMQAEKLAILTGAETTYNGLVTANAPIVANGDYYIVNVLTGKYLNANAQTKASIRSYGQLMTVAVKEDDKTSCTIDSHYKEGANNHYLDAEGFLNGEAATLRIENGEDGKLNITNADDKFLTASAKNDMVTFANQKTEGSEWTVLTRAELIEKLSADITEESPADVTSLLFDPGFDKNNDYFSEYTYSEDLTKLAKSGPFSNVECYHEAFDFAQTIEDIPNGVYELTMQGFYRADTGSQASTVYYANGEEQELKTAQSEGKPAADGGWSTQNGTVFIPNSMEDASKCFAAGAYANEPITVTVTNHMLKIGVKTTDANNWVIWDNFNLKLQKVVSDEQIAADVVAKIDAIGKVVFTKECKDKIDAARAAYDALTDEQKELVADAKVQILEDAEEEYDRLKQEETPSEELKKSLTDTIAAANAEPLEEAAYTAESLKTYNDALAALKDLSRNKDATKTQIETALQEFKAASEGLVVNEEYKPTEKQVQDLAAAVENAAKLEAKNYIEDENWAAFQETLAKAQSIKEKSNATKTQVEKAMKDLQDAIAKLTLAVDKTALNAAIAGCANLKASDYIASTWNAFEASLNAAKAVAAKDGATQAEVDAALADLNAKKAALKTPVLVSSIKLSATYKNVAAGKKTTVKATVNTNATDGGVTFTSSNSKWATVNAKTGVVTTKKAGAGKTVTITATANDAGKKKQTIKIKIMKNAVTKVTVKKKSLSVKAGKKVTIKATVKTNGSKANKTLSFTSSNTKWATVSSKGKVTTKKAGKGKTVKITVASTDGTNKKATVKIKITK